MTHAQPTLGMPGFAELEARVARLTAQLDELRASHDSPRVRRRWRRYAAALGVVVSAALFVVGVAGAAPTTSTTNVTFVPLTPPHKVLGAVSIAANKSSSPVVIGAATTVPADATTVQLSVTAKGAKTGTLNFYPADNPAGASGQTLPYPAGSTSVSTIIQENVGQSGELTFANAGAGAVVVTASITGYSTQVTAGDINGTGGSVGQVLTDTGSGASWQSLPPASIVSTTSINGQAGTLPNGTGYHMTIGAATVQVQAGQAVAATVTAALGSSSASPVAFSFEACYLLPGASSPTLFSGPNFMLVTTVPGARLPYTSSESMVAQVTGQYRIGLCADPGNVLDNNDWVNGTVLVINR